MKVLRYAVKNSSWTLCSMALRKKHRWDQSKPVLLRKALAQLQNIHLGRKDITKIQMVLILTNPGLLLICLRKMVEAKTGRPLTEPTFANPAQEAQSHELRPCWRCTEARTSFNRRYQYLSSSAKPSFGDWTRKDKTARSQPFSQMERRRMQLYHIRGHLLAPMRRLRGLT